jgi:hypothetical protein
MSEAELLSQFSVLGQTFLFGLQAAFTIVSAYVVALYFFLGHAPFVMKLVAFVFFTAALIILGVFLTGAIIFADGLAYSLTEASSGHQSTYLGHLVGGLVNHDLAYAIAYGTVAIGVTLYGALFYLTFLYAWPPKAASGS